MTRRGFLTALLLPQPTPRSVSLLRGVVYANKRDVRNGVYQLNTTTTLTVAPGSEESRRLTELLGVYGELQFQEERGR